MNLQNTQVRKLSHQKVIQLFKIYQAEPIRSNAVKLVELESKESRDYQEAELYADYLVQKNPYNHTFIEMLFLDEENQIVFSEQNIYLKAI